MTAPARSAPSPSPEPPRQPSASDALALAVVRGLEMRTFVPGQRLVEADLCARFGVARTTVREAFQRLAAHGIVEIHRHRGASIRTLSLQEALEVLDVAEAMISLLVRTAARNIGRDGAAPALRAALADLDAAAGKPDWAAASSARRGFYHALHQASGNRELRRLFNQIHLNVFQAQLPPGALDTLRWVDYQKVGKAVLAGDEAAADAAWRSHVARVRQAATDNLGSAAQGRLAPGDAA